jgi:hypothetical protein
MIVPRGQAVPREAFLGVRIGVDLRDLRPQQRYRRRLVICSAHDSHCRIKRLLMLRSEVLRNRSCAANRYSGQRS